jgi:pimeloyl-ACP methyl ester carboxylesterase
MLFIHGNDDERIPVGYVVRSMARLRQQGASVDEWLIDGQDHFLFFDRDAEVLGRVRDWVSHL